MNYSTMSYIPQQNHWLSLLFKFTGMVGGAALVATMLTDFVHKVGAPAQSAPVAAQVAYFAKGIGKIGQNQHWTTQASENTREWQKAKAYCQSQFQEQSAEGSAGQSAEQGCSVINELANSGY